MPITKSKGRRDSNSSVKSLVSYNNVRDSLGKMHAYVERVSKLDKDTFQNGLYALSKKHSNASCSELHLDGLSLSGGRDNLINLSLDKHHSRSQQ